MIKIESESVSKAVLTNKSNKLKIQTIIYPHRDNDQSDLFTDEDDDSCSDSSSDDEPAATEEEQTTTISRRRRRRNDNKLVQVIVEQLESKIDEKIEKHATKINKKIDKLSNDVSKLKESFDTFNRLGSRRIKRDRRSRSNLRSKSSSSNNSVISISSNSSIRSSSTRSRSISRSRTRSRERGRKHPNHRERSQEREQTESSNFIDTETLAHLREEHTRPTTFSLHLMLKLFSMDELTVKNVNVEGRAKNGSKERAVALSPTRVAELKRLTLLNVRQDRRKSVWKTCRTACNQKLSVLKRIKEGEENSVSRSSSPSQESEQEASNFINNETIAYLRNKYPTPAMFSRNLMLKLFTMDEMTAENVNLERRSMSGSKAPAVTLSPTRVAEIKRLSLQNVAIDERESVWKECRIACNKKLCWLKEKKEIENRQMIEEEEEEEEEDSD